MVNAMMFNNKVNTATYPADSINNPKHPDHNKSGFMVRATKQGYYGVAMREAGDVFRIEFARHFADSENDQTYGWMEKVDEKKPKQRAYVDQEARGAKPPPRDPNERDAAMSKVDRM